MMIRRYSTSAMAQPSLQGYRRRMIKPALLTHNGADLAYHHKTGAGPLRVFLPGYMSDMTGSKAEAVAGEPVASLRLDYSGCGASSGDFLDGSISCWAEDALAVINHVAPTSPVILIGSSMGGWIALRLGLLLGSRLAGIVTIAAAPDFTRWGLNLSRDDQTMLSAQGYFTRPSGYDPAGYRYSRAFIDDAPGQCLLDGEIPINCPVRLIHGQQDEAVPWRLSLDIAERVRSADVQVLLIKDGDHRLSRPQDIALLLSTIKALTP